MNDREIWDSMEYAFAEDGDPIAPLAAVVFAVDRGEPVPAWALEYLAARFRVYLRFGQDKTLDEVLGLKALGKGQEPARKTWQRKPYETELVYMVWKLHHAFGLKVSEATRKVEAWCERHRKEIEAAGLRVFTEPVLRQRYYEQGWKDRAPPPAGWSQELKDRLQKEFDLDL